MKRNELYQKKATLLKALGHPLRLKIIDILRQEEITVSQLCEKMEEEQANISRHLSILRKEEIIDYYKKGVNTYYNVKYTCITNLNVCLDEIMKTRLQGEIDMLSNFNS